MDGHEVGRRKQLVQRPVGHLRRPRRQPVEHVVPDRLHAHDLHAPRHLASDPPEADHAKRLAGDVVRQRGRRFAARPRSAARELRVLRQAPRQRDDQDHGEVRYRRGQHSGRVADRHAARGGGRHVDAVVADARRGDHAQARRRVQKRLVHGVETQERVRLGEALQKLFVRGRGQTDDLAGGGEPFPELIFQHRQAGDDSWSVAHDWCRNPTRCAAARPPRACGTSS